MYINIHINIHIINTHIINGHLPDAARRSRRRPHHRRHDRREQEGHVPREGHPGLGVARLRSDASIPSHPRGAQIFGS